MKNKTKKLAKRFKTASLYGVGQSLGPITLLIISYFIIKFKSIELWGGYVEVLIWINLLLLFISFGNKDFLLKSFSKQPSKINQLWFTNLISRTLLLLPCFLVIYIFPFFKEIIILAILWLFLLFINQSYQILILYHKHFKFSLITETVFSVFTVLLVILKIHSIDLITLLNIIVIANGIKAIFYTVYYLNEMMGLKLTLSFLNLKQSIPFFIPLTLGTVRVKIDTYYANSFFNQTELGEYQILISFLNIGHLGLTYFVNPYLKNFFRSGEAIIKKIKKQFIISGFIYSILFIISVNFLMRKIYSIHVETHNYIISFFFLVPLLIHMLIVNQIYKHDQQNIVGIVAFSVIILQVISGYFLVTAYGFSGALLLKTMSQWIITIILWTWYNTFKNKLTFNE